MTAQADRATAFHALHQGPDVLKLANAWDAGTARLIEHAGAKAVATTSAGVAWAHGYPDGDALPVDLLIGTIRGIVRCINLPLTVDIEGGYAADAAGVGAVVARVIEAGAVGINIEDGGAAPDLLAGKIAAARAAASAAGIALYINARTDVYLRGLAPVPERVAMVLDRAARYRAAGASGLFVPGLTEGADIKAIVAAAGMPLNVMARPGLADAAELGGLGVRRLSAGSGITQATWGRIDRLARDFLDTGRSAGLAEGAMAYGEINGLFSAG